MKKSTSVVITASQHTSSLYFADDCSVSWIDLNDCCSETLFRAFHVIRQIAVLDGGRWVVEFGDGFFRNPNPCSMAIWLLLIRSRFIGNFISSINYDIRSEAGRPKATSISRLSRVNPFDILAEGVTAFMVDLLHRIDIGDCSHKGRVV